MSILIMGVTLLLFGHVTMSNTYTSKPSTRLNREINDDFWVITRFNDSSHFEYLGRIVNLPLAINLTSATAIDYSIADQCFFFADLNLNAVVEQCLKHSENIYVLAANVGLVRALAFDWLSKVVYFASLETSKIEILKRTEMSVSRHMLINIASGSKIRSIAVHPNRGYLFWSDIGTDPSIWRANLDGTNVNTIVRRPHLAHPLGIAIDHKRDRIYWIDSYRSGLSSSDLNGQSVLEITRRDGRVDAPMGIAIHGDLIFFINYSDKRLNYIGKDAPYDNLINPILSGPRFKGIFDFKIYSNSSQHGSNACSNGSDNCSYICVGAPSDHFSCLCSNEQHSRCLNGKCVPNSVRCNGVNDCGDESDELNCMESEEESGLITTTPVAESSTFWYESRPDTVFRCADGTPIKKSWVCDGDFDCPDNTDELNCGNSSSKILKMHLLGLWSCIFLKLFNEMSES